MVTPRSPRRSRYFELRITFMSGHILYYDDGVNLGEFL